MAAFKELAREVGRLLSCFVSPAAGFKPASPIFQPPLSREMRRDLGAASASDFFALALGEEGPDSGGAEAGRVQQMFPLGPESVRPALAAAEAEIKSLDRAVNDLERNWPAGRPGLEAALRPLATRREALDAGRGDLALAVRLWPRLKLEAAVWPEEARGLWRRARRLEESLDLLLKSGRRSGGADDAQDREAPAPHHALTRAAGALKSEAEAARAWLAASGRRAAELASLTVELDDFLALAVGGSEPGRDWAAIGRRLAGRLNELDRAEKRSAGEATGAAGSLEAALRALAETEKRLTGVRDHESRNRLEAMNRGVAALWRSTVDRRLEMARLYFFLPPHLGRPVYLEKVFLSSARALGRAQSLLEDLRRRLLLAGGRFPGTHRLKNESAELLEKLRRPAGLKEEIGVARGRFKSLMLAVRRQDRPPAERTLASAALEKELTSERLAAARRSLEETGLLKARLIKVFDRKSELLKAADLRRERLAEENRILKAEREALTRRRVSLVRASAALRERFKELGAALAENQGRDLSELLAERREAAARLEDMRRERDTLEAGRRDLTAQIRGQAAELAETGARAEALAAELSRHREELGEASRSRRALSEISAALRRQLDLLVQAHGALQNNLEKKELRLVRAEAGQSLMRVALTRQKRNLLRLVAVRQNLRAELGSARLKLADLENERAGLLDKLEEARRRACSSDLEKKALTAQLTALAEEKKAVAERLSARGDRLEGDKRRLEEHLLAMEREKGLLAARLDEMERGVSGGLTPFIAVLNEALWRSEARFGRAQEAFQRAEAGFKLESDVREANLRLAGAAREIELTESHQAEIGQWEAALSQRENKLAEARQIERGRWEESLSDREAELDAARETLRSMTEERGRLAAQAQEKEAAADRLGRRSRKLGETVGLMKRRYGRRLAEAGRLESNLRQALARQTLELAESRSRLAELEPWVEHFLRAAERTMPPGDDHLELVRQLREENQALKLEAESPVSAGEPPAELRARMEALEPLVAFMARSFVAGVADLALARQERAELEGRLAGRETELKRQTEEIVILKSELAQADRDLAENDGRLEAAWAAMNYLGSRAGDSLGGMRGKLDRQARRLDGLTGELARRDARIRDLESRQDKLSLLYWTLVAHAREAGQPSSADSAWPVLPALPPAVPALEEGGPADQAGNSGGFSLGRQLLEGAKKVARRNLFSLILAGSLVMAGPAAAAAENEPLLGGRALREVNCPPASQSLSLASRFDSSYIGRPVALELVEKRSRLAGRAAVEKRLSEMTGRLAAGHGLADGEFLRLIRAAKGPGDTVHLSDFGGRKGGLALLGPHFPKLVRHLVHWPPEVAGPARFTALLKAAANFKAGEGGFWERLFFDLWAESEDPAAALGSLLNFLERLKLKADAGPWPEYAGRLAPFEFLETLGFERFVEFVAPHIKSAWLDDGARPRELAARRLAADLYFNARLFRLPRTLFVALIQQEAEEGLAENLFRRGAALAIHHRAAHLASLTRAAAVTWEPGRPPLCDLDEALARGENEAFVEAVYRKKMALVQAVNRGRSAGATLLAALPD